MDSGTIAVPSDVQRCPAVPKPANSAPSTARSMSASSMTTIGFLPPSSRHGDCRWRPHSAPILDPTAEEPVKPTLSTRPASSAASSPANVSSPEACTRFSTPPGTPPAWKSLASASPSAALYSAGFHTTALPHRIAGTRYHAGTATGKLPAVTIAATPTGTRNVNSCLSGISDGTVCPYSRRPSPRKKSHVSTISCTSPSDSGYGLPTSRVTRRDSASLLASTSRPTCAITRPRAGAGTRAHSFCAARAARAASTNVDASPSATSATTSSVRAGLVEVRRPPGASARASPPMTEAIASSEAMVDMATTLAVGQRRLQRLESPDLHRIGAAQHGRVERHEIAEQHERHEPLQPRLTARGRAHDDRAGVLGQLRRQLDPPAVARVRTRVVEQHAGEAPEVARRRPAHHLVVVGLGQRRGERRQLGVLVELGLPAVGGRGGQPRAHHDGDGAVQRAGQRLRLAVVGRVRPPLGG